MKVFADTKITNLLEKELNFASFAIRLLESELKPFESKYEMNSIDFVTKFEKGELGDDRVWFNWYSVAMSAKDWYDTKEEIRKTLATA